MKSQTQLKGYLKNMDHRLSMPKHTRGKKTGEASKAELSVFSQLKGQRYRQVNLLNKGFNTIEVK